MVRFPLLRMGTPMLLSVLGPELKHWCAFIIEGTISMAAIIIAWEYKVSAFTFYSAVRGGRLFADGLFNIIVEKAKEGVMLCPGMIGADFDPNESVLDEIIGFIIAFQGFLFQTTQGFMLPFPFNLLLLPFTVVENTIRSSVSCGAEGSLFAPI